jgi:hypothetical protein
MNPIDITISARSKFDTQSVPEFLETDFNQVEISDIGSLFGFTTPCKLYGGRKYTVPELNDDDLVWMYSNNINYRIPLTNHYANADSYNDSLEFLEKHHRKGNSVIIVKDDLAKWIKRDFPLYHVECSVIKEVNTYDKILKNLDLYDSVVPLPESINLDYDLLNSIPQDIKDRIRLFLNSGCGYNCPARICYPSLSKINSGDTTARFKCSQLNKTKFVPGPMKYFDVEKYKEMGYTKFKLLKNKS